MNLLPAQDRGFPVLTTAHAGIEFGEPFGGKLARILIAEPDPDMGFDSAGDFQHLGGGQLRDGLFDFQHSAHDG